MEFFILLSISFIFLIIELLTFSLIFIFFSFGFLLVAILTLFISLAFHMQIFYAFLLSLILLFLFRNLASNWLRKDKFNNEFLDESGIGVIKNGMIYYKGTFFNADVSGFKDGDEVKILGFKNNKIIFEDKNEKN